MASAPQGKSDLGSTTAPKKPIQEYGDLAEAVEELLALDAEDLPLPGLDVQRDGSIKQFSLPYSAWMCHRRFSIKSGGMQSVLFLFDSPEAASLALQRHGAELLDLPSGLRATDLRSFLDDTTSANAPASPLLAQLHSQSVVVLTSHTAPAAAAAPGGGGGGLPMFSACVITQVASAVTKTVVTILDLPLAKQLVVVAALAGLQRQRQSVDADGAWLPPVAASVARLLPLAFQVHGALSGAGLEEKAVASSSAKAQQQQQRQAKEGEGGEQGPARGSGSGGSGGSGGVAGSEGRGVVGGEEGAAVGVRCAKCGKEQVEVGEALLRCGRCRKAHYCGKECQRSHWGVHKAACQA